MKGALVWERLIGEPLPYDDEAERYAIGAVLLAPDDQAKRIVKLALPWQFYDLGRERMWARLREAILKGTWGDMALARLVKRLDTKHPNMTAYEISVCINEAFWWHGPYYVAAVTRLARKRERIIRAVKELRKAMDE